MKPKIKNKRKNMNGNNGHKSFVLTKTKIKVSVTNLLLTIIMFGAGAMVITAFSMGILYPLPEHSPIKLVPDIYRCSDSDGGQNYYEQGLTTGLDTNDIANAQMKNFVDNCLDSNILREYYCVADWAHYVDKTCENGCENGVCKNETAKVDYCCGEGEEWCFIDGKCELNGQKENINCLMREGQNMELRMLTQDCNVVLNTEGRGMGMLNFYKDMVEDGQKISVKVNGNISSKESGGIYINGGKNISVLAGNINVGSGDQVGTNIKTKNQGGIYIGGDNINMKAADVIVTSLSSSGIDIVGSNNNIDVGNVVVKGDASKGIMIGDSSNTTENVNLIVRGNIITEADLRGGGLWLGSIGDFKNNKITITGNIITQAQKGMEGGIHMATTIGDFKNNEVTVGNIIASNGFGIEINPASGLFEHNIIKTGDIIADRFGIEIEPGRISLNNNTIETGNIVTPGFGIEFYGHAPCYNNVIKIKSINAGYWGVYSYGENNKDNFVCINGRIISQTGKCQNGQEGYEEGTIMVCENGGNPVKGCDNSTKWNCSRDCSQLTPK